MKKRIIWIVLTLFLVGIGFGLWKVNKDIYPIWNANSIEVTTDESLTSEKVKIEFGVAVNTINRGTDTDLFKDRTKYTIVYDGGEEENISNEYGENDFLITYDDEYYLSFRQFKFNWKNQQDYIFHFFKENDTLFVHVKIEGEDRMEFKRPMIPIRLASKYRCNTPLEEVGVVYDMVDLKTSGKK